MTKVWNLCEGSVKKKEKLKNYGGEILFSIVMPVYNVEIKWLDKAIESIEKQNYKNWEICIADDCPPKLVVRAHLSVLFFFDSISA